MLIALAYGEGLQVAQIELDGNDGVYHVGGTSIGTHHTKDLADLYIHLLFLEFADEPLLHRRYASIAAPFSSASELRPRLPATPRAAQQTRVAEELIERMRRAFAADPSATRD